MFHIQNIEKAKKKLLETGDVLIACHINPDGDTIGSLLALGLGLESLGKNVIMISQDGVPERYRRLPGAKRIRRRYNKKTDAAVSVDCSAKEMLGESFAAFKKAGTIIEIDHHEYRKPFGDISVLSLGLSSVGEIVYYLLKRLNVNISQDMAQNILTSIIVETNSFNLPGTNEDTFKICADLMKTGLDYLKLTDMVYWSKSKAVTVLSGICLARCKFIKEGKIAWSIIREKDFRNIRGKDEDVDAVADQIRAIGGVRIAVLFREKTKKLLRVSLRSKGAINVAALAEKFAGGGHYDIAGCYINNDNRSIRRLLNCAKRLV